MLLTSPKSILGGKNTDRRTPSSGRRWQPYNGGTTVMGSALLVNNISGLATGFGSDLVSGGAELAGDGAIAGDVDVASAGRPGTFSEWAHPKPTASTLLNAHIGCGLVEQPAVGPRWRINEHGGSLLNR
jgi:hypothetical protein